MEILNGLISFSNLKILSFFLIILFSICFLYYAFYPLLFFKIDLELKNLHFEITDIGEFFLPELKINPNWDIMINNIDFKLERKGSKGYTSKQINLIFKKNPYGNLYPTNYFEQNCSHNIKKNENKDKKFNFLIEKRGKSIQKFMTKKCRQFRSLRNPINPFDTRKQKVFDEIKEKQSQERLNIREDACQEIKKIIVLEEGEWSVLYSIKYSRKVLFFVKKNKTINNKLKINIREQDLRGYNDSDILFKFISTALDKSVYEVVPIIYPNFHLKVGQ